MYCMFTEDIKHQMRAFRVKRKTTTETMATSDCKDKMKKLMRTHTHGVRMDTVSIRTVL